jgi:hypothetical protein
VKKALFGWAALARTLAIQLVALVAARAGAAPPGSAASAAHLAGALHAIWVVLALANAAWTIRLVIDYKTRGAPRAQRLAAGGQPLVPQRGPGAGRRGLLLRFGPLGKSAREISPASRPPKNEKTPL